jgi:hypothetical protein
MGRLQIKNMSYSITARLPPLPKSARPIDRDSTNMNRVRMTYMVYHQYIIYMLDTRGRRAIDRTSIRALDDSHGAECQD